MAKIPDIPTAGGDILEHSTSVVDWIKEYSAYKTVVPKHPLRNTYRNRFQFQVELSLTTANTVNIRNGHWIKYVGNVRYDLMIGDGDVNSVTALAIPAGSGTAYIYLYHDHQSDPDPLVVMISTVEPISTAINTRLIAHFDTYNGSINSIIFQDWRGGIKEDMALIPDGIHEDYIVKSLNYTTGVIPGLLQDYAAKEILVDQLDLLGNPTIATKYQNDYAIPYFDMEETDVVVKKYARIDSQNAGSWVGAWGKSLEIVDTGPEGGIVFQLLGFGALNSYTNDDAKAAYINVNADGTHNITYAWPVSIDDGSGYRPRNTSDGGASTRASVRTINNSGGALSSYFSLDIGSQFLVVDESTLKISSTTSAIIDIPLKELYASDITWDMPPPALNHNSHDPANDTGGYSQDAYKINIDHDMRYWGVHVSYNTATFPGTSTADYYTNGEVRADRFALVDDPTANSWDNQDLFADVSGEISLKCSGSMTLNTDNYLDIISAADATLTAGGNFNMLSTYDIGITAGRLLGITSGTILDITAGTTLDITGVDIDVTASNWLILKGIEYANLEAKAIRIESTNTDIELYANDDVNLRPMSRLLINNRTGKTVGADTEGFYKGILTSDTAQIKTYANLLPTDRILVL